MRAIAEPKYEMHIVAKNTCASDTDVESQRKNAISIFKIATLGVGSTITFYVDFLNSNVGDGRYVI